MIECRFLRGLIARRVGMLGWKLRVKCWTQDVGRHEWHACTVTSVCVPPLHSSTAMHGDSTASALVTRPARGGRSHARDTSKGRGPGSCERSAGAGEDLGPLVIEHQVQWDADEVAFAPCHSNACSHPGASKWMRALHVLHVLWSRRREPIVSWCGQEDEWLKLPEEEFQIWKPRAWWSEQQVPHEEVVCIGTEIATR